MAQSWHIDTDEGIIKVDGTGVNQEFQIEIQNGSGSHIKIKGQPNATGKADHVIVLSAGSYTVTITAPPDGPVVQPAETVGVAPGVPVILTGGSGKLAPVLDTTIPGQLTVSGAGGGSEPIRINITPNTGVNPKTPWLGKLGAGGTGSVTFTLPAGTYTVDVTAPNPGGTFYEFLGVMVK